MTSSSTPSENCPDCGRLIPDGAPQGLCPKCLLSEAAVETVRLPGDLPDDLAMEEVGSAFPELEILERIGEGGMGIVYKARQRRLDRVVALKLLRCPREQEALFAERFLREARALAKLNHPNIVTIYDFGESQGYFFLIMEFVDGVNLRQAMMADSLRPNEALRIVPVICEALHYAHEQGVLHRDIKPANILLDRQGVVKMADFGLAKFVGEEGQGMTMLTQTEASLGTPAYMAPEQTTDPSRVDHRADIYSLGVVFYEMLTGGLPLGRFPVPSKGGKVDRRVDDVVMRTLEREPEERYQSAKAMQTDVEDLSKPGVPPPLSSPEPAKKKPMAPAPVAIPMRYSTMGAVAAVLVAISLLGLLVGVLKGFQIANGIAMMAGIPGTLFGWISVARIRADRPLWRGLGLSSFAALCWPTLVLIGVTASGVGFIGDATFLRRFLADSFMVWLAILTVLIGYGVIVSFRRWLAWQPVTLRFAWVPLLVLLVLMGLKLISAISGTSLRASDAGALAWGKEGKVEALLKRGIDVNVPNTANDNGENALMFVAREGNEARVRLLLQHGADPNLTNAKGENAFLLAAGRGNSEVLQALLEYEADIHFTEPTNGLGALHLAAKGGNILCAQFLLDRGLESDIRTKEGQTPLMLAIGAGQEGVMEFFLQRIGGLPLEEHVDRHGHTALDYAMRRGNTMARRLLSNGYQETANWWFREAFVMRSSGWDHVISSLEKAREALEQRPVDHFAFSATGWHYTFYHPRVLLEAALVEAAAFQGEAATAQEAWQNALRAWPESEGGKLLLYERQDYPEYVKNVDPLTVQRLWLERDAVDAPLRENPVTAWLTGTSQIHSSTKAVVEHPITSTTLFR